MAADMFFWPFLGFPQVLPGRLDGFRCRRAKTIDFLGVRMVKTHMMYLDWGNRNPPENVDFRRQNVSFWPCGLARTARWFTSVRFGIFRSGPPLGGRALTSSSVCLSAIFSRKSQLLNESVSRFGEWVLMGVCWGGLRAGIVMGPRPMV